LWNQELQKKWKKISVSGHKSKTKKEYERLQKEKREKKERETRLKAQLEQERKERAEKLGSGLSHKDKEQQELEFRQKEAEKEKQRILQQRARERAEKERVLKLLEEDKQRREAPLNKNSNIQLPVITTVPNPALSQPPSTSSQPGETCMIQIRLPHGNPLRQKFKNSDLLQDVHNFVASNLEPGLIFTLIIPMPRREFSDEDMEKTIADLKLNGVSLTVLTSNKRGVVKQAEQQPIHIPVLPPPQYVANIGDDMDVIHNHPPPAPVPKETLSGKINKIPTFKFTPSAEQDEAPICLICQCPYIPDEDLKKLPCAHDFHTPCVDSWLVDNDTCPLCTQKAYE